MSVRFATFAHAMSSTNAAAPISSQNVSDARSLIASRSGDSVIVYCDAFSYASG